MYFCGSKILFQAPGPGDFRKLVLPGGVHSLPFHYHGHGWLAGVLERKPFDQKASTAGLLKTMLGTWVSAGADSVIRSILNVHC